VQLEIGIVRRDPRDLSPERRLEGATRRALEMYSTRPLARSRRSTKILGASMNQTGAPEASTATAKPAPPGGRMSNIVNPGSIAPLIVVEIAGMLAGRSAVPKRCVGPQGNGVPSMPRTRHA